MSTEQEQVLSDMRVKEIKAELDTRGINYRDCFDKESLAERLLDAREGRVQAQEKEEPQPVKESGTSTSSPPPSSSAADTNQSKPSSFDRKTAAADLRKLKVSDLRTQLGHRGIRWSNMIEKEEMVKALVDAMEVASHFSVSGAMSPGKAADLTDEQLNKELQGGNTPILLDVYATWCGPCKLMAPQLQEAAEDLGDKVRVAKLDSDAYQELAGKLRVSGLPTVILFSKDGKELKRQEGAMMKNMLMDFVGPYL